MRQKTSLTIVEKAKIAVSGFSEVASRLEQQVELRGQSKSTLENYIRRIALISLHFNGTSFQKLVQKFCFSNNHKG